MNKDTEKQLNLSWLLGVAPLLLAGSFVVKAINPEQIFFYLQVIVPVLFLAIAIFWVCKARILSALFSLTLATMVVSCGNSSFSFVFGVVTIFLIIVTLLYGLHLTNKTEVK